MVIPHKNNKAQTKMFSTLFEHRQRLRTALNDYHQAIQEKTPSLKIAATRLASTVDEELDWLLEEQHKTGMY